MNEADQLARQRLIVMNAVRLSGVGLALLGLMIIAGKIDLGREIGAFFFVIGLFEALFMPAMLAKRWRTPRP